VKKHQLVLFIDDIQWMDESSKQLITFLWNDQELSNIMLILAYRDENADCVSSMLRSLSHVDNIVDIGLKNLEINDIHDLVSLLMASSSISDNQALTENLKIKTGGNPFHIVQLIEVAEKEGFLFYDSEAKLWEFDIDSIQSQIMISNSLAELFERKARL
jgi:predicted ATPase